MRLFEKNGVSGASEGYSKKTVKTNRAKTLKNIRFLARFQ